MKGNVNSALGVAAALLLAGSSAAYAQTANGSDISGPPSWSLAGGAFAPLPTHGITGSASSAVLLLRVRRIATDFASGSPQRSPGTVQLIPAEDVQAVGELLTTGSPGAQARVARALQGAGAPPSTVAFLTQALGELATASARTAPSVVLAAATQFDALVTGVPTEFLRNPPGQFLAIHVALVGMVNALR
jgi:hypothetical protein